MAMTGDISKICPSQKFSKVAMEKENFIAFFPPDVCILLFLSVTIPLVIRNSMFFMFIKVIWSLYNYQVDRIVALVNTIVLLSVDVNVYKNNI